MPIYEYRCSACAHEFETIQKVGSRPLRKCPECSGRLNKLVSRAAFQLKGGGWYAQDYSKSNGKPKSTPSAKSESKSADKKPSKTAD